MTGASWLIVALLTLEGCWMIFDGVRAFIVGDYVTPAKGAYAGQLGPWAGIVSRVGLDPHSNLMKAIFVFYGAAVLVGVVCYALQLPWAWWGLLVIALLGLWYLPIGTGINLVALIVLLIYRPV